MNWKKGLIWGLLGTAVIFVQSFSLRFIWGGIFVVVLSWVEKEPWWVIFYLGTLNDILQFNPLGLTTFIYLIVVLIIRWVKKIMGTGKSVRIKVKNF